LANSQRILAANVQNLQAQVGEGLTPVMATLTTALVPLVEFVFPILADFLNKYIVPGAEKAANAFRNFTTGVKESGFDLASIFENLNNGVNTFLAGGGLEKIFTTIAEMRMNFFQSINKALPGIIDAFIKFIPQLIDFLLNTLLPSLVNEFIYIVAQIAETLLKALPKLVEALLSMVPGLLEAAITLFNTLIEAVVKILPSLIKTIVEIMPDIVNAIVKMLPDILRAAIQLFTALVEAIPKIIPPLLRAFVDLLPVIVKAIVDMLPTILEAGVKLFIALVQAIPKIIPQLITAVMGLIPVIVDTLLDSIPLLIDAGFQILKGLAQGILENAPKILGEAAKSIGTTLVNGVKALLGIKSPSKVFYDLGLDVGAGFVAGMRYTLKEIEATATEIAQAAADKAQAALNKAGITNIYSNFGVPQNLTTRAGTLFDVGKATDDLNAIYDYMGARTAEQMHEIERFVLGMTFQEALDTLFEGVSDGTDALVESINNISQRFADLSETVSREGLLPDEVAAAMGSLGGGGGSGLPTMAMAAGGFVKSPVNALVGEAGPEVVMPLDRFENLLGINSQSPQGSTYNITINAGVGSDPVSIGRYVTDAIKRYESVSGKVFASA
jgi:hypothetical protein